MNAVDEQFDTASFIGDFAKSTAAPMTHSLPQKQTSRPKLPPVARRISEPEYKSNETHPHYEDDHGDLKGDDDFPSDQNDVHHNDHGDDNDQGPMEASQRVTAEPTQPIAPKSIDNDTQKISLTKTNKKLKLTVHPQAKAVEAATPVPDAAALDQYKPALSASNSEGVALGLADIGGLLPVTGKAGGAIDPR